MTHSSRWGQNKPSPRGHRGLTHSDKLTDKTRDDDSNRDTRELFAGNEHVRIHLVSDRLSRSELDAARATARETSDARMSAALDDRGGSGFTQSLAGAG